MTAKFARVLFPHFTRFVQVANLKLSRTNKTNW